MAEAASQSTSILNLVNRTLELPTIPEVLTRLNDAVASEDSTAEDVADVIAKDPAVAANLLRIVNSVYYGLQVRVSSISLAVSVLGFNTTKKVALKAAVFSRFAGQRVSELGAFDPQGFWRHSIFTGVAARAIGRESVRLSKTHAEDLYICGLLHDIGKIILIENVPEEYRRVLDQAKATGRSQHDLERELLGFTHADVGSVLAIKWFLPEELTIAIRYHHAPAQDPFRPELSSLIHLADHIAWSAGRPSMQGLVQNDLHHEVYGQIGIEPAAVEDMLPRIEEEFESSGLPF